MGFAPLILSLSVAVALSRLVVHGIGGRVLVPIIVCILVADVATALALRLRINMILAVGLGWAVSLWALAIAVDPTLFDPASSHFFQAGELSDQLRVAQSALANDGTPLPSLNGMVGILGAIGGIGAALTRAIWAMQWRRSVVAGRGPLSPCLAPSLAIFVYTSLVSAEQGRVAAFVSYLIGVLAFVALADRGTAAATGPTAAAAAVPRGRRYRLGLGALAGCLLVTAVAIAVGAGLSGMRLTVFHVNPTRPGAPKNPTPGPAQRGRPDHRDLAGRPSTGHRDLRLQGGHLQGPVARDHLLGGGHPLEVQRHRMAAHRGGERGTDRVEPRPRRPRWPRPRSRRRCPSTPSRPRWPSPTSSVGSSRRHPSPWPCTGWSVPPWWARKASWRPRPARSAPRTR